MADQKLSWSPQMTRVIFDHIEREKGKQSLFIRDRREAFARVLDSLQLVTSSDVSSKLHVRSIETKLQRQASHGGVPQAKWHDLFVHGISVLRLWDPRIQENVFSKEQVQASKDYHVTGSNTSQELSTDPGANDTVHHNRATTSVLAAQLDISIRREKRKGADGSYKSNAKKARTTAVNHQDAGHETREKERIFYGEESDGASDKDIDLPQILGGNTSTAQKSAARRGSASSKYQTISSRQNSLLNHKKSNLDPVTQHTYHTCDEKECNAHFASKDDLERHYELHANDIRLLSKQLADGDTSESDQEESLDCYDDKISTLEEQQIINYMSNKTVGLHEDVSHIAKRMEDIQISIYNATKVLFAHLGIDARTIITLNVASYEHPLIELLDSMFHPSSINPPIWLEQRLQAPNNELQRLEFVAAVVGAAVTNWTLTPLPQGPIDGGILGQMNEFLRSKSASLQDNVMEMATKLYLERHVVRHIDETASAMSSHLFYLLRHFLPGNGVADQAYWPVNTHGSTSKDSVAHIFDPRGPSSSTNDLTLFQNLLRSYSAPTQWPRRNEADYKQFFLDTLTKVFKKALRLRTAMEAKGNGQYRFVFPKHGDRLRLEEHVVHRKETNLRIAETILCEQEGVEYREDMEPLQQDVLIGLSPVVYGTFRTKNFRNAPWDEEIVISRGCVHLYNMHMIPLN